MNQSSSRWFDWLSWGATSILFVLPLPLLIDALISLLTDDFRGFVGSCAGYLIFTVAACLIRRGLASDMERRRRPSLTPRSRPLKIIGSGMIGLAVFLVAFVCAAYGLPTSLTFGALATIGCLLVYGFDRPMLAGFPSDPKIGIDDLTEVLNSAYGRLESIDSASRQLRSGEFRDRCGRIVSSCKKILNVIETNPQDLRRTRKFLGVYLDGVEKVIRQYARTHAASRTVALEQNFRALLIQMENTCQEQYSKVKNRSVFDLDVQIEVLMTRLKHEGVA